VGSERGLSRDEFLRRAAVAGGVVLSGGALAERAGAARAAQPKQGGVLHIGCGGGGKASDSLDANTNVGNEVDIARNRQLYDTLFDRNPDFSLANKIAEEATPNEKGDVWTVRLRKGVEFHNGKTVTADDLIFSIQRCFDPKLTFSNCKNTLSFLNLKSGIKKLDANTVRFTLAAPNAIFRERLSMPIIPIGYNGKQPVGTGPFMYKTFTPGVESTMDANKNYWGKGPYADQVVITNISDDTARVNALLSGQVHAINALPYAQIPVIQGRSNLRVLTSKAGTWRPITMRVDAAPFNDNRVREAFRLIVDRPQMLAQAIGGHGRIANDLYSPVDPCFNKSLPQRHQDIAQAKSLLKAAGHENMSITMTTAPVNAGVVEMSQVFAAQAKNAGVTVKLNQIDPGTFYGSQYLKYVFSVDYWTYTYPFLQQAVLADGPNGTYNETHFNDPEFNKLFNTAIKTVDDAKRCQYIAEMQKIQWERGGYIVPFYPDNTDAYSAKLGGMVPYKTGVSLGNWNLKDLYFT
jgi:peptide/nickel transport system substrate-binding protein